MRVGSLAHQERSARVGGEDAVPLLCGNVFQRGRFEEARVVDQNVQPAELLDHRGYGLADALGVVEVGADGEGFDIERGQIADGLFGLGLRVAIGDGDVGSAGRKRERDGATDAPGPTGDQRGVARKRGGCVDDSLLSGSGIAGLYGCGAVPVVDELGVEAAGAAGAPGVCLRGRF